MIGKTAIHSDMADRCSGADLRAPGLLQPPLQNLGMHALAHGCFECSGEPTDAHIGKAGKFGNRHTISQMCFDTVDCALDAGVGVFDRRRYQCRIAR